MSDGCVHASLMSRTTMLFFFIRHQVNAHFAIEAQDAVDDRAGKQLFPTSARGQTQHKLGDMARISLTDQRIGDIFAADLDGYSAEVFGEAREIGEKFVML